MTKRKEYKEPPVRKRPPRKRAEALPVISEEAQKRIEEQHQRKLDRIERRRVS